jgi:hypothetical protein
MHPRVVLSNRTPITFVPRRGETSHAQMVMHHTECDLPATEYERR